MRYPCILAITVAFAAPAFVRAQERTLFRTPAVSQTSIVFAYAGDLWRVPRAGGDAMRLTSSPGMEANPVFSPDGAMIAFNGQYDGNIDVFVVPAAGGTPKRLTFHPAAEFVCGWTPDSKRVVFYTNGSSANGAPKLYTVDLDGGLPELIPLPQGTMGAFSPDGSKLVYSPVARANQIWKNYRGGRATPLWIANLADSSFVKIPRTDSNDYSPMWVGSRIYFLSDRNGRDTLFDYDTASRKVTQLIAPRELDIKAASATTDAIAYERFGEIHLYELKSHKDTVVPIRLAGDLVGVRPRLEKTARSIANMNLSPSGVRAVFEARGDIYTVPAEKGDVRNLTATSGVAERDPAWSPDGKWIACFSDESGEYQLHVRGQSVGGEVRKFPLAGKPTFFYSPVWSPDSKKIAYLDKQLGIFYIDLEKKTPVLIDRGLYSGSWNLHRPQWSPDSKWIAYNRQLASGQAAVFLYSLDSGKPAQITDGMSDARWATWDAGGKYLYFSASTDVGPLLLGLDLSNLNRPVTRSIYAVVLSKDDPSPLAPESDEEKSPEEKKKADADKTSSDAKDSDAAKKTDAKKVEVRVDLDGISQRIVALPMPPRNYASLATGKTGVLFYMETPVVQAGSSGLESVTLHRWDMTKRKSETFQQGVSGFRVSSNGEKILLALGGEKGYAIVGTGSAPKAGDGALKLDGMETFVDPVAEWNQMFHEAWRIERDYFYDPHHHGLDLQAAGERYQLYLKGLGSRSDLEYLFQEMWGQLSVGHLYIGGGDFGDQPRQVKGGLLGADYQIENGRYRFARVYNGESWNPQTRAPLTEPGVNVKAGEYLLAVNGRELRAADNVYRAFEDTAGKRVLIRVGPNANGDGARDVTVMPVEDEVGLRTLAWVEDNRRTVSKLSGGKLAYIHLPDTANGGYTYFNRYYFAQTDKEGAIIDERFNRGGLAADYVIDHLRRPVWSYWAAREGEIYSTPGKIIVGPKVMIANENSGSGGDMLPWLFKRAGLGPLVGKRTWGGLVGIGGFPQLIDGGGITAPYFRFFTPDGKWEVENHGVDPDHEVDLDPKAWREGHDTQLEKAVALAMAALEQNPPHTPVKPAYPDFHKGTPLALDRDRAAAAAGGGGSLDRR